MQNLIKQLSLKVTNKFDLGNNNEEEFTTKKDCLITETLSISDINSTNKLSEEEENVGNLHFTIRVQKALKEAIEQNDKVYSE